MTTADTTNLHDIELTTEVAIASETRHTQTKPLASECAMLPRPRQRTSQLLFEIVLQSELALANNLAVSAAEVRWPP